ncbi:hypothetical protein T552_01007 [Pneumocystis carinii B80]|uniref:Phospholipase/carboxylesterase/thioesterase domain-containing protein n=1 Tax=Pneumocystis carinii (strain B80) TaxID=1408658 RepID=A0A0W4ZN47_PNEC8|nr:hypothetical protein T552_01007 [Pneumocystis carinii B80]KTW29802.1 hypothetical protein T552_01007 [Pneumocystis carinii B80]
MKYNKSTQYRIPTLSDLPEPLKGSIIAPNTPISNCLILLHGLGGSHIPFARLARHLNLPETVCISLCGLKQTPLVDLCDDEAGSWHWGSDLTFDDDGIVSDDADLQKAIEILEILCKTLTDPLPLGCGFVSQAIFFLGYGQGGRLALNFTLTQSKPESPHFNKRFGGVLSIGGIVESFDSFSHLFLNESLSTQTNEMNNNTNNKEDHIKNTSCVISRLTTPILLCGGDDESRITSQTIQQLSKIFYQVEHIIWKDHDGDTMPRNRKEWYPLLQWFSQHLLHTF